MSDRAETEKTFNLLQEEYHQESLPQVIETNLNPGQLFTATLTYKYWLEWQM